MRVFGLVDLAKQRLYYGFVRILGQLRCHSFLLKSYFPVGTNNRLDRGSVPPINFFDFIPFRLCAVEGNTRKIIAFSERPTVYLFYSVS